MKIAIVTFIRAYNHGAVLQCYALHKKLNDLGIDNEVLDYYPEYFRKLYELGDIKKWRTFPGNMIKKNPGYVRMRLKLRKRNRGFERFIKKNIRLSKKQYCTTDAVVREEFAYDGFVVGSDQVWSYSITEMDPVFFLDFPYAQRTRKLSYAASFGVSCIPERLEERYKRLLSDWDSYSVREDSGAKIMRGLLGVEAQVCCDPTLLLSRDEWARVSVEPEEAKDYVLVYYVNSKDVLLEHAQRIAKEQNLKIIVLTSASSYNYLMGCDIPETIDYRGAAAPDELVGLVRYAKYVLTDSFHGTVFSLIFQRRFMTLIQNQWGRNLRALALLETLGLSGRKLDDSPEKIDEAIDWERVEDILSTQREAAVEYLASLGDV